eukprot:5970536-Prymnesium_polylepis.1
MVNASRDQHACKQSDDWAGYPAGDDERDAIDIEDSGLTRAQGHCDDPADHPMRGTDRIAVQCGQKRCATGS